MKWEHLYEYYDSWSTNTLINRLSTLEDYGAPDEVVEVADVVADLKVASRFVRKAIDAGVVFSPDTILTLDGIIDQDTMCLAVTSSISHGTVFSHKDILELDGLVDEKTLTGAVKFALDQGLSLGANQIMELDGIVEPAVLTLAAKVSGAAFSPQELTELDGIVDHDVLVAIDKRQGTMTFDYEDELVRASRREKRPGKLFTAFATIGMLIDGEKKAAPRFRVGDRVRVRYRGQEGTIVDINGNLYMVSLADGRHVDSYEKSQLEKVW